MDRIMQEIAASILAGLFSLVLLVILIASWMNCRQDHKGEPPLPPHNRDSADYKRGV